MFKEVILPKLVLFNTRLVLGTYTALSLPFYTVYQKPWRVLKVQKQRWTKVEYSPDGSYYYWKSAFDPVVLPNDYHLCKTFQEMYQKMKLVEDPNQPKIGVRHVLSAENKYDSEGNPMKQDGRIIKEIRLADEFTWMKTREVFDRIDNLAKGFRELKFDDKVLIFADTRYEWLFSALAIMCINLPIVTLFSNLGQKGFIFGVNQQRAKYLLTSYDLLERIHSVIDEIPSVEKIIYMQHDFQKNKPLPKFPDRVQLIPFDRVQELGKSSKKEFTPNVSKESDIGMIMYTSGTTGIPKAVIFSNKQIKSAMLSLASNVADIADQGPFHRYASFLPLAHSMGFTVELFLFIGGVRIGYSSPYTLSDTSPGNPPGQIGDLKLLKPTTLVSVPLVLDRIVKEIYSKLSSRSPLLPPIFTYLMEYKTRWVKRGYKTPLIDKLVCKRVQEQFGGNLEFIVCGGAALDRKTEELIRSALDVQLLTGYGLTETTGGVVGKRRADLSTGTAGVPLQGAYIRLIDWKEGGYTINDKPNPRGEILISGDSVAEGYYELEEETKSAFKTDSLGIRWFYSGDIGEILPNGSLKIIDRKKDLAKLPNGEYVSLGKIETTIKTALSVENCCVCLDNTVNDIVALIAPNSKQLKMFAQKLNKSHLSYDQLCADPEIGEEIFKEIRAICKASGFHPREIPARIHVCNEEWTTDNDLLTSALKLKRNNVLKFYSKEIQELFKSLSSQKK